MSPAPVVWVSNVLAAPPQPNDVNLPGNAEEKLGNLMGWGLRGLYIVLFFAGLAAIAKMAVSHHRGEEVNFKALGTVAVACIAGGSIGALVTALYF